MGRRALIVVIAVLGAVPVLSGLFGIVGEPGMLPAGQSVNATVDSEYRFTNVFWLAGGLLVWWSLRRPQERAAVTRVILAVASLGAIPRLISIAVTGWPHPVFIGALVLELLVVPLVIWWHVRTFTGRPE
ncbi:DUF4345 domain-containing protein [Promicromonospora soli]|uniref:DUF4345 domain-containing protein n=1 Tax=Promicromonospora soli TaxID=2035533 RepID=A0A919KWS5_9MICO|nr:DUF4345 domain-containing protein [Promicromonospora soli]GHH75253.1 hypothetical protein GCM10017772_31150 [Promicromonospora soli]